MEFNVTIADREPLAEPRFRLLTWFLILIMGVILGRSFYLQIVEGHAYQLQAEENRVAAWPLPAPRGIMYDRHGKQLSANVSSTDVVLDPTLLPLPEHEAPLFDNIIRFIAVEPSEVRAAVETARREQRPNVLRRAVSHEDVIAISSALDQLPGVRLESSSVRSYDLPRVFAHVVGYTAPIDTAELAQRNDLTITDSTGKAGLEKQYDALLRGRRGAAYREVDAGGRPQHDLRETPPVAGTDVYLAIDAGLQEYIYHVLEEQGRTEDGSEQASDTKPAVGAVVALDPRNGAVRALVSYPSFDPNVFSQPALRDQAEKVLRDPVQPLFNRAVGGTYAPGSTIKPLLAAAGLEQGVINPSTTTLSTGGIRIGEWFFPDWKAGGHGATDVGKALAESVNTFFYVLVGGYENVQGLGVEEAGKFLRAFSWGSPTKIDMPGEEAGLVPGPQWKEETLQQPWYIGDTYHLAIGQGDVLVTPLQVAVATAAIANDGRVFEPQVVERERTPDGQVTVRAGAERKLPIGREHLAVVRQGMRQGVTEGSGRRLSTLPLPVAGKTGTAQIGGTEDTHAWFTSFGPYESPELVLTILLERGGEGDDAAVPVAQKIWQWWAENKS